MSIECMEFRPYENGTLQGFANLWVPKMGLEIYGCSLHMKDGRRWLNLPSKEYKNKEGETKYQPVIRFREKDHLIKFCQVAKEAVEEWCSKQTQVDVTMQQNGDTGVPF